jgi:hypothetical protein
MKNKLQIILALLLISVLLTSCAGTQEAAPAVEESAPEVEEAAPPAEEDAGAEAEEEEEIEETALLVGEAAYSMSALEGMDTVEVEYTGKDDQVTVYSGVLVTDLLAEAGLEGETAVFVASDGYEAELAIAELEGCPDCVVAFDEGELRMVLPGFPGNVQVKGVVEIQVK